MIIKSIELNNYRLYKGLNKISFSLISIHISSFNSLIAQNVIDSHSSNLHQGTHQYQFIQGVFCLFNNNILSSLIITDTTAIGKLECII
jgi:hypothetical protein